MDKTEGFFKAINENMTAVIATAAGESVIMRDVSPVLYRDMILIFTARGTKKYEQLSVNPHCCIAAGSCFAEATAEFRGATMPDGNAELREAYAKKFKGAFDDGIEFGGRNAEFILLKPTVIRGWAFENGEMSGVGIPTVPFEITLK